MKRLGWGYRKAITVSLECHWFLLNQDFPGGSDSKRLRRQCRRPRFDPWVEKIPWRKEWQPAPVFLPGESHGQNSLVGYSPWGRKELGMTEWLSLSIESGSYLGHPGQELWQISTTCLSFLESMGRQGLGAATNLLVPMAQASAQSWASFFSRM